MFDVKYFFCLIFLPLIIATPQVNLYYTGGVNESESESNNALQHTCLRVAQPLHLSKDNRETTVYCMNELSPKFQIENDDFFPKFTFAELSKQNITSQQLYLWSTPINIIERYQFYLNQLSMSNDLSLAKEVVYNCTLPRFGPRCQYELYYYDSEHSSLSQIIDGFYRRYIYIPTTFTCYNHLQCNRGTSPSCLDWSEICDGKIDCLDGGYDEEHCWELEINQCKDDEYQCTNGQCIPKLFLNDGFFLFDCIDGSDDGSRTLMGQLQYCHRYNGPSVLCEDIQCVYTHWTSSCVWDRIHLLEKAMHSSKDSSVSKKCWLALKGIFNFLDSEALSCTGTSEQNECKEIVKNTCPDVFYFPNVPVLFNDVYFIFTKNDSHHLVSYPLNGLHICYNKSHYDDYFVNIPKILFNNMTCVHSEQVLFSPNDLPISPGFIYEQGVSILYEVLKRYHSSFDYIPAICNRSNMYQCLKSSKCIPIHRLLDTIDDCPYLDDENITVINNTDRIEQLQQNYFKCHTTNKYIPRTLVGDVACDCGVVEDGWCEDEDLDVYDIQRKILFQHICDGFFDLLPVIIEGRNETDETECQQWECNNIYTRCNGVRNCPDGADEGGCISYLSFNCSSEYHLCVSPRTNQFMCLPIEKANDGHVDCLGATDEPTRCRTMIQTVMPRPPTYNFYCMDQSFQSCIHKSALCNNYNDCPHGDDEQFCTTSRIFRKDLSICDSWTYLYASDVEKFLCDQPVTVRRWALIHFTLQGMIKSVEDPVESSGNTIFSSSSIIQMSDQHPRRCHRGLDLRVWLSNTKNLTNSTCLCPLSFYGNQCQYQNQRISLTIKFQALSDSWRTLFTVVVSLIDDSNERIIHSYEQLTYLGLKNCKTRYNIYLVYSTRPKNSTKHYSIHIDIYEKVSRAYRGSLLFPITFPFLPVHRLAFIVDIPRNDDKTQSCPKDQCIHGKCIRYSNNPANVSFCQCDHGWSGQYCTIPHICTCSSDSLCIGVSANNRSICVCLINKFGSRCLLTDTICQNNNNSKCQNGGQCVSDIDDMLSNQEYICICKKGFRGDRCEIADNKLVLSFGKGIVLSHSIFIHFIEVIHREIPVRSTTFRTIPVKQDSITVYWSRPFHLVFIELDNKNYYLTVLQNTYNKSVPIVTTIHPSDRCPNISELFNETFLQWHPLRRIKYYHLLCQKQSLNLSCFYDNVHLCLCYSFGQKRLANCFNFEHYMAFDCKGQSECEHGARCLQDKLDCPTKSMCICPPCFYGRRCQFSTSGFGLSLDAILGYHISPHLSITDQPFIVQFSLALTIILMLAGMINGVLSLITFKTKIIREVGCGLYLFGSSITIILAMMMFGLKFLMLLLAQMTMVTNRSFLQVQCTSLDFILRVCLNMDQWFNACVAAERAITTIKGPGFVKKKSKQAAKFVIVILLIVIIGTNVHDSIYRRLIDETSEDDDVKRIWCIVIYPSSLEVYNYVIHCFHFFGPFLINLVSSIILIMKKSLQQSNLHKKRPYKEILREQFREHKHLLTAPLVLVFLAVPRLILVFMSKCMKSTNDSWLFLIGYFISLIPPMLTFIIFIVPSKFYKKEFRKAIQQYRNTIQRRLHIISSR